MPSYQDIIRQGLARTGAFEPGGSNIHDVAGNEVLPKNEMVRMNQLRQAPPVKQQNKAAKNAFVLKDLRETMDSYPADRSLVSAGRKLIRKEQGSRELVPSSEANKNSAGSKLSQIKLSRPIGRLPVIAGVIGTAGAPGSVYEVAKRLRGLNSNDTRKMLQNAPDEL
jgi:hypothetical protein